MQKVVTQCHANKIVFFPVSNHIETYWEKIQNRGYIRPAYFIIINTQTIYLSLNQISLYVEQIPFNCQHCDPRICCKDVVPLRPRFLTEATKMTEDAAQFTYCPQTPQRHQRCKRRGSFELTFNTQLQRTPLSCTRKNKSNSRLR